MLYLWKLDVDKPWTELSTYKTSSQLEKEAENQDLASATTTNSGLQLQFVN